MHRLTKLLFIPFGILIACSNTSGQQAGNFTTTPTQEDLSKYSKAYFASGCFWCVEAVFQSVEGVAEAISGYTGGNEQNPTYRQVSYGQTGHAEAVEVYYDPAVVSYETLLVVFFGSHDPTTLNQQGPDRGAQYRSGIYYQNDTEKNAIDVYIQKLVDDGLYTRNEITTEIAAFMKFWPAEDYHQEYERLNPNQPYVRSVSIPRLNRFKAAYPELLKEEAKQAH
ncbi:MAG TPA: peptide-methionine (S)-S-oxide reductase [Cytophagales bacterium]|nr:peptide-methionine (S)-S-oxide reductase [Cytophagales bacterium]HAA17867.1 peptide-methionine (S)-S-oxide reductase [Cytophagales bacterium]HAP58211.1 peptide-methionine (S)-S-oxide reductase [Cytophagales bacterium]